MIALAENRDFTKCSFSIRSSSKNIIYSLYSNSNNEKRKDMVDSLPVLLSTARYTVPYAPFPSSFLKIYLALISLGIFGT